MNMFNLILNNVCIYIYTVNISVIPQKFWSDSTSWLNEFFL